MFAADAIARLDVKGKRLILSTALAGAILPVIPIVTIPVIILGLVLQRRIVAVVTNDAVKG